MAFLRYSSLIGRTRRRSPSKANVTCVLSPVESLSNPKVKAARALQQHRTRKREGKIVVEGHRLVLDAIESGLAVENIFFTSEAIGQSTLGSRLEEEIKFNKFKSTLVTPKVMKRISETVTPQGVVAIAKRPHNKFPDYASLVLVCDEVRDPGNIGTLTRAAAAAGVDGVAFSTGCADVWGPKALRSGMGAHFRVPIAANMSWKEIKDMVSRYQMPLYLADGASGEHYSDVDWTKPAALIIGSEADGPSIEAVSSASMSVAIPLSNGIESLNAGVAGAVILFEAHRQRFQSTKVI